MAKLRSLEEMKRRLLEFNSNAYLAKYLYTRFHALAGEDIGCSLLAIRIRAALLAYTDECREVSDGAAPLLELKDVATPLLEALVADSRQRKIVRRILLDK